jgi:predicted transglutaminase-like cysteine proteinase
MRRNVLRGAIVAAIAAGPAYALECPSCAVARTQPARSTDYLRINVIGGVKFVSTKSFARWPKWERVQTRLGAASMAQDPRLTPWISWAQALRGQPPAERLSAINQRVNQRIRYQIDRVTNGVPDYWQTPLETVTGLVGDCEDYAILKYYLALQSGFTDDDLAVVVGTIPSGEAHSVLIARVGADWKLLDNRTNMVVDLGARVGIASVYFVDGVHVWIPQRGAAP